MIWLLACSHELKTSGFSVPESVLHDPIADVYLVSNIAGEPGEQDDNGFISRVAPDGALLELRWISGSENNVTLHGPKGMALVEQRLYVADIDALRVFDRSTGVTLTAITIPGAISLNDVTPDGSGGVFVSDAGTGVIHGVDAAGGLRTIAKIDGSPNGIYWTGSALFVATFDGGDLLSLSPDGAIQGRARIADGLDGIVVDAAGRVLISSWDQGGVLTGAIGGKWSTVANGLTSPADIGYDATRNRLLVPLFEEDAVQFLGL